MIRVAFAAIAFFALMIGADHASTMGPVVRVALGLTLCVLGVIAVAYLSTIDRKDPRQ